jgi:FxsC-like protein
MMDLTKYEDDYKQFVTRLANKIVDNAEEYQLPDVPAIRPLDAVNSAFHSDAASQAEEGDRAWFAFVAGKPADFEPPRTSTERYKARGGKDWRPFDPESLDSVGIVAQTVSSRYQRYFSEMPVDTSLIDRIKALKHEPVFVLVDAWSVTLHDYQEIMRALDGNITDTCAVVIAWNSPDDETERYKEELKRNLLKTFKYRAGVGRFLHYWGDVDSPAGLQARLLEMMAYYTNRVLESNQTPTAKEIDNEQAKTSLEERGLGVERPPTVQSTPGDPH